MNEQTQSNPEQSGDLPAPLEAAESATPDPAVLEPGTIDPATGAPLDALAAPPGGLDRAIELFQAGGPVVAILIALSVIALTIVLVKLWQFGAVRVGERRTARAALRLHQAGRSDEALALAGHTKSPVARVLAQALRGQRRGLPEDKVREEVMRSGGEMLEALRAWFRPLEVIASLAPLLGLFGTVLGMIEAFQQLEQAGSQVNPAILSGGIWEALLTTAVGLAVAMPTVALLNWMERIVDRLAHEMESVVTQVFTEDLSAASESEHHEPPRLRPAAALAGE